MLKERVIKYRHIILLSMAVIWFCMFFTGVGLAFKDGIVYFSEVRRATFFEWYIKAEKQLFTPSNDINNPNCFNIKAIFTSLYVVVFLIIGLSILVQKLLHKKFPSAIYLVALLPFIVSCCICLHADTKDMVGFGNNGVLDGGVIDRKYTYLPAIGDWLSAIIALLMFGFSWLCNHWIKQGIPLPEPKERKPKKPKTKTDKERIAELEKQVEELSKYNH